ncbi:flagellar filament capping protein FliD [Leifsonia kafniensis]|uniref:Flagellar hook-associated protein 2 n=1 Tax=Leifsonia kafniensis TaxID=475957 RepID=A0ABP7K3Z5_9MICO
MASSLAIDGLVSGLDTTALINSLMKVEQIPQTLLKNKVASSQSYITALQALNTKFASLTELATKFAKPLALDLNSATSTSNKVTVTATPGTPAAQLDLTVGAIAQAQKSVTGAMTEWPESPAVLTITGKDGVAHEITADSQSLDDVVAAVNTSDAGVIATKVSVGGGNFRLQFASKTIGEDGAFSVYQGTGTATPVALTEIQGAKDASITIWAGTPAAQTITSKTNTFTDVLPGVSITVSAISVDPVTVTVTRDDEAISKSASALVDALNGIFADVVAKSAVTTSTDATGTTKTTAGVFTGDSTVRDVNQKILAAATEPINGRSPSEFGISITKKGAIEYDAAKFKAAMAKDPVATQAALQVIATRVADAGKSASDKYDGALTSKITGQESEVKVLGTQVDDWDRRLTSRRATLERTYSALEVQLSKLNSQQSYMASQLAALTSS